MKEITKQDVLDRSSASIKEYLDNVSDEEFLALYDSVAIKVDGITVDEYLSQPLVKEYLNEKENKQWNKLQTKE